MGSAIDPNGGMGAGAGTQGLCNYQKRDQNQKRYALIEGAQQLPGLTNTSIDLAAKNNSKATLLEYDPGVDIIAPGEGHQVYHST